MDVVPGFVDVGALGTVLFRWIRDPLGAFAGGRVEETGEFAVWTEDFGSRLEGVACEVDFAVFIDGAWGGDFDLGLMVE